MLAVPHSTWVERSLGEFPLLIAFEKREAVSSSVSVKKHVLHPWKKANTSRGVSLHILKAVRW